MNFNFNRDRSAQLSSWKNVLLARQTKFNVSVSLIPFIPAMSHKKNEGTSMVCQIEILQIMLYILTDIMHYKNPWKWN